MGCTDVCKVDFLELDEVQSNLAVLPALEWHLRDLGVLAHFACHKRCVRHSMAEFYTLDAPTFLDFVSAASVSKSTQSFTPSLKSSDIERFVAKESGWR
jgi:hypothetical protein